MSEDHEGSAGKPPEEERRNRFSRFSEQLSGLLDPEAALRRGQGLVTGVSRATKEEFMRIVSGEVRSFLDKIDIADLAQQIVAGLEVDIRMQVKFSRNKDGRATANVRSSQATFSAPAEAQPPPSPDEAVSKKTATDEGEPASVKSTASAKST